MTALQLRVATWNMDHWKRMRDEPSGQSQRDAWAYLQGLGVDVALVQEAVPPPFIDPATWHVRSYPASDQPDAWFIHRIYRRWGSAVVIFNPWLQFEPIETTPLGNGRDRRGLWISHPGSWAGIKPLPPDRPPVVLISAYGVWDDWNHETKSGYGATVVNRMLSDLTPLIDSEAGKRTLLAGDLNIGTQYTDPSPRSRAAGARSTAAPSTDSLASGSSTAWLRAWRPIAARWPAAVAAPPPTADMCAPSGTTTSPTATLGRATTCSPPSHWPPRWCLAPPWMMKRHGRSVITAH